MVWKDAQTGGCLYDFYIKPGLWGVRTAPCNPGAPWQQYTDFPPQGQFSYHYYINNYSGYCLDSNYGSAYETPCNFSDTWQRFNLG